MMEMSSKDSYKVTPEVLEERGNVVDMQIDVKYPAKFFNKKAILTVTPVLKYEKGETAYPSETFQGEGVQQNFKSISFATGGTATMKG